MEDDLYFSGNGRRPQFFRKWKTTPIFQEMEDDLVNSTSGNRRRPQFFQEMEDDLNFSGNGRRPQFFQEMEDDLNFSGNGGRPKFFRKCKTQSSIKAFYTKTGFLRIG